MPIRTKKRIARRDWCGILGRRMWALTESQAAWAWYELSIRIERLEEKDIPKFWDLGREIRSVQFHARQGKGIPLTPETGKALVSGKV